MNAPFESVSSIPEAITYRAALVVDKQRGTYPLGFGQVVPAHVVGEAVYSGAAAELPRLLLVAAQVALIGGDAFAAANGEIVTFEQLLNAESVSAHPHRDTIGRRTRMAANKSFAGFIGESEKILVDWDDIPKFMPKVEVLDRLRAETRQIDAARAAGKRTPHFAPPLGDNQGWFLKTATPRKDGLVGYDPAEGKMIEGLVALPIMTAIHGYFVDAMQKQTEGEGENKRPVFPGLGTTFEEGRAAIAKMTAAVIAQAGGKPGDMLYFGHITAPKSEDHAGPDLGLMVGFDHDDTQIEEDRYASWFHTSDITSNQAKRGFDAHSINNLRALISGMSTPFARYNQKRASERGLVRLDNGKLRELLAKKLVRAKPAPQPQVSAPTMEPPKPALVFAKLSDGSVLPLLPSEFKARIADIDGVQGSADGAAIALLPAAFNPAFKDAIPALNALEGHFEVTATGQKFPWDGVIPVGDGTNFDVISAALLLRQAQLDMAHGPTKVCFRALWLDAQQHATPVWGEDYRDWDTALSLASQAADVNVLATSPVTPPAIPAA